MPSFASNFEYLGPTSFSRSTDASSACGRARIAIYGIFESAVLGKRLEISVISCLIIGLIGYSALGIAIASDRISHAERTLNGVIAHQNMLNASFQGINSQLSTLGSSPAFDVDKTLALIDQSVAGYELTARTVSHDDAALSATERQLIDQRWLTMVSADRLDRVHARIGHARHALAMARDVAADEILDGQFWRELYRSLADMKKAEGQKAEGDLSAARTTLAQIKWTSTRPHGCRPRQVCRPSSRA